MTINCLYNNEYFIYQISFPKKKKKSFEKNVIASELDVYISFCTSGTKYYIPIYRQMIMYIFIYTSQNIQVFMCKS